MPTPNAESYCQTSTLGANQTANVLLPGHLKGLRSVMKESSYRSDRRIGFGGVWACDGGNPKAKIPAPAARLKLLVMNARRVRAILGSAMSSSSRFLDARAYHEGMPVSGAALELESGA